VAFKRKNANTAFGTTRFVRQDGSALNPMGASCAKYLKKASKTSQSSSLKSEPNCLKKERKTFAKSVFTSKGPLFIFPNRSASSNRTGNNRNAAEKRGFTEYASGEGVREHGAEHGEKPRRGDQHQ